MRRHSHTGAYVSHCKSAGRWLDVECDEIYDSRHTGYVFGLARRRSSSAPGGQLTSATRRGNTSGTLPSGRSIPMRPRRLCTWLCHCGRRLSGTIFFTLGPRLLPPRTGLCQDRVFPHVRILGLLRKLAQPGNTGGAASNTCSLSARVHRAWEVHWRLPFAGLTSSGRVLDLIMQEQCCLQRFLPIVPLMLRPRLALSRSSSTLLLHWDVPPLGA